MLTPLGAAFGLAGAVPLLTFGLALDKMDWEWIKKVDEITRGVTVQLFGTKRQVRCDTLLFFREWQPAWLSQDNRCRTADTGGAIDSTYYHVPYYVL